MRFDAKLLALLAVLIWSPVPSGAAGPLSFGSGESGTADYSAVLAIAKAASVYSDLDIRPRPFKAPGQAIPFVDSGEISFGLSNGIAILDAYNGTGSNAGEPLPELRLVGAIYPFRTSFIIRADSSAKTIADLKGLRVITSYRSSPATSRVALALLATAGLTAADVDSVDVSTSLEGVGLLEDGSVDAVINAAGSPILAQIEQAMGPVRFLTVTADDAGLARAQALVPNARFFTLEPATGVVGMTAPTTFLEYDYFIYASTHTPDDVVVGVIDALIKGKAEMTELLPAFAWFDPTKKVAQIGLPYHPAAEAHYKELGLWAAP